MEGLSGFRGEDGNQGVDAGDILLLHLSVLN